MPKRLNVNHILRSIVIGCQFGIGEDVDVMVFIKDDLGHSEVWSWL